VLHTEILLPAQFDGTPMPWARNRERLWNTVEHTEKSYNARVAREIQVTLPAELALPQRIALARSFAREMSERYRIVVDLAVHAPRAGGDPRHFHAHLLMSTREVNPFGLGAKAGLDMHASERRRRGLCDHRQEFVAVRERWATLANQALREAHSDARIDHRSLAAQGIDREPLPHIPIAHLKMEQRGLPSPLAERLRAEYRGRVLKRLERSGSRAEDAPVPTQPSDARRTEIAAARPTDVAEIRRQAREAWLRLRSQELGQADGQFRDQRQPTARSTRALDTLQPEPGSKDDLAL